MGPPTTANGVLCHLAYVQLRWREVRTQIAHRDPPKPTILLIRKTMQKNWCGSTKQWIDKTIIFDTKRTLVKLLAFQWFLLYWRLYM